MLIRSDGISSFRMKCSPKSNKFGRTYDAQTVTFGGWIIRHIARDETIGRGSQRDGKEWLVIRIG